jgi:hypothetical protein
MRKEDLDRRRDELKARILAERNEAAKKKFSSSGTRESASRAKPSDKIAKVPDEISSAERAVVAALKKRIAQLAAKKREFARATCHNQLPGTIAIPI